MTRRSMVSNPALSAKVLDPPKLARALAMPRLAKALEALRSRGDEQMKTIDGGLPKDKFGLSGKLTSE